MKRTSSSHELIFDRALLFVNSERSMLGGDLFAEHFEARFHRLGSGCRATVGIMEGEFVEPSVEEVRFERGGGRIGQQTFFRSDREEPQFGLISRCKNIKIQRMLACPRNQFSRRISPAQPKGRLDEFLGGKTRSYRKKTAKQGEADESRLKAGDMPICHKASFRSFRLSRKPRYGKTCGFMLVEMTMSLSLLTVVGLILLKLSLNVIHPRQHTLQQVLTDSYLTYERSLAERTPFEDIVSNQSLWPMYPQLATEQVYIGKLPGGQSVYGDITRTRVPDSDNYPIDGGTGNLASNPAAMKIWRVQSILSYKISDRTYVKSRTVVRSQ